MPTRSGKRFASNVVYNRRVRRRVVRGLATRGGAALGAVGIGALAAYGTIKGVQRIRRARKRVAQRKQMSKVGLYKAPHIRKSVITLTQVPIPKSSHTLEVFNLCKIDFDQANNVQDKRQTKAAYIYGFRHEEVIENLLLTPITVHQFWIVPTINKTDNADLSAADIGTEWFNEDGGTSIDTINFPATDTYLGFNRRVNGAKYKILKRITTHLQAQRDSGVGIGTLGSHKSCYLMQNLMIPCKKTFTYEDFGTLTQTEQPPVYYVRYISIVNEGSAPAQASTAQIQTKLTTYFKDIQ